MSIDTTRIRPPVPDDLEELVGLCADHAAYERADYDPEGKAGDLARLVLGAEPRIHCLVAADGSRLAGYATWTYDASTWDAREFAYLDCLYLTAAYRGQGLGRELLRGVARAAHRHGCVQVQWHTPDFNRDAIRFYARIGAGSKSKVRFFLEGDALHRLISNEGS
jgi:GNAT superfamily N-acetyltransferase